MFKLIQLEWLKWSKHNSFRVLMIAYAIILPAGFLTAKRIPELPPPIGSPEVLFIFPTVWPYLAYFGNWVVFFLFGLFAVIFITTEYANKTLRQNIITGLNRKDYFIGKIGFLLSISFFATAYYALWALMIGYFNTDYIITGKVIQNIDYVWRYFLMVAGYMILGMFFGFWVKRTGLAIILYLGYTMFIEVVLRWAIHFNLIKGKSMHFYPVKALSDVTAFPMFEGADKFLEEFDFELFLTPTESVITILIYSTLLIWLCTRILKRADL